MDTTKELKDLKARAIKEKWSKQRLKSERGKIIARARMKKGKDKEGREDEIERCRRLIDALKVEAEATRRVAVESIVAMAMEVTDD